MSRAPRWTAWLLAALPLATLAAGPVAVATLEAGRGSALPALEFEGTLQARQQATVSAQAQGRVLLLAVKAGDRVQAGQLLARIDERELQAAVAGGEAAVLQARAALAQAEQHAARTRELRAQGFVSTAALDTAVAQLQSAQGALQQAQAGRSQASLARSHASVTAPFAGVVQATHVEAGDLAVPGRPLVTLFAPGALRAVVQVPASRAAAVRGAGGAQVVLADGSLRVPERRTEMPTLDAQTQTLEWRLDLPAAGNAGLQPGQPVRVRFDATATTAAPGDTTLRVPASAVLQRGELSAVYAVQEGRFVLKAVRLGARQGDSVAVLAGLKPGERIAADAVRAGLDGATPAGPAAAR